MSKSGLADSPFFSSPPLQDGKKTFNARKNPSTNKQKAKILLKSPTPKSDTKEPTKIETTIPRHHVTTVPRYHDTMIETVRKAVKEFGKEAATHRFTEEEKKKIAEILYSYKQRGIRTSENEITRIAVNFLVSDHKESGKKSILYRVLEALND